MAVSTFLASGKKMSYNPRAGFPKTPVGTVVDGVAYQRPRLTNRSPIHGSRVRVTNPRALTAMTGIRRTRSAGSGGVGQERLYH